MNVFELFYALRIPGVMVERDENTIMLGRYHLGTMGFYVLKVHLDTNTVTFPEYWAYQTKTDKQRLAIAVVRYLATPESDRLLDEYRQSMRDRTFRTRVEHYIGPDAFQK